MDGSVLIWLPDSYEEISDCSSLKSKIIYEAKEEEFALKMEYDEKDNLLYISFGSFIKVMDLRVDFGQLSRCEFLCDIQNPHLKQITLMAPIDNGVGTVVAYSATEKKLLMFTDIKTKNPKLVGEYMSIAALKILTYCSVEKILFAQKVASQITTFKFYEGKYNFTKNDTIKTTQGTSSIVNAMDYDPVSKRLVIAYISGKIVIMKKRNLTLMNFQQCQILNLSST